MSRAFGRPLLAALFCLAMAAADAMPSMAAQGLSVSGNAPFGETVVLRGTLGRDQVQAKLRASPDPDEGLEGDYAVSGQPRKILLGELDGDDFFMEESANGKDVSGKWSGKLSGDVVSGTWQSADGLVTKPFNMKIVRNGTAIAPRAYWR